MKYLKRYNEELTPANTKNLKTAASIARRYQQTDRSDNFRDYSDIKEFGVYKMNVYGAKKGLVGDNLTFTEASFDNITYGNSNSEDLTADTCVKNWSEGYSHLQVSFDVCFRPTRETFHKLGSYFDVTGEQYRKLGTHFTPIKNDYRLPDEVKIPLFRMSLILGTEFNDYCDSCGGAGEMDCPECDGTGEEYYNGGDDVRDCEFCTGTGIHTCQACNNADEKRVEATTRYKKDKCFILYSSPAKLNKVFMGKNYKDDVIGIFSDTKSVRKFQVDLPSAQCPFNKEGNQGEKSEQKISIFDNSELKSKIMDLLSILHGGSKDIERVMDLFYNIPKYSLLPQKNTISGPDGAKKIISDRHFLEVNRIPYKPGDDNDDDDN